MTIEPHAARGGVADPRKPGEASAGPAAGARGLRSAADARNGGDHA
jgi:hypothetical protein